MLHAVERLGILGKRLVSLQSNRSTQGVSRAGWLQGMAMSGHRAVTGRSLVLRLSATGVPLLLTGCASFSAKPSTESPQIVTPTLTLGPTPIVSEDPTLALFCAKSSSASGMDDPAELRLWVRRALLETGSSGRGPLVNRWVRELSSVNPYLAYSLFHTTETGMPTEQEVLAWFPTFVRAVLPYEGAPEQDSPYIPKRVQELGPWVRSALTPTNDLLFTACLRQANHIQQFSLLYQMFKIGTLTTISPVAAPGILTYLRELYDRYLIAVDQG
jgi:hypothetical protein